MILPVTIWFSAIQKHINFLRSHEVGFGTTKEHLCPPCWQPPLPPQPPSSFPDCWLHLPLFFIHFLLYPLNLQNNLPSVFNLRQHLKPIHQYLTQEKSNYNSCAGLRQTETLKINKIIYIKIRHKVNMYYYRKKQYK